MLLSVNVARAVKLTELPTFADFDCGDIRIDLIGCFTTMFKFAGGYLVAETVNVQFPLAEPDNFKA